MVVATLLLTPFCNFYSFHVLGPLPVANRQKIQDGLDPAVLIDAIATCMAHEEKELCKTGQLAMSFIVETASTVLGSKQRVSAGFFFFPGGVPPQAVKILPVPSN